MQFYAGHRKQRDYFEILAFHDPSVKTLPELRHKLKPIIHLARVRTDGADEPLSATSDDGSSGSAKK